ncbi:MAG: TonB-dependent receptor [Gammaproteobacteria bacterium]|nr:TonB-dependent receptor [Gammaproteobacteria bacterium]
MHDTIYYENNPPNHNEVLNSEQNILALDIEDLLNIEVTSVGKKEQTLSDVAAAVFVITEDDIKQSGVTNIPEALRMAPGIEVARINSSKWAISSRGFNSRFANKLLVMIDGRTVYTPSFSGVYWEVQDTVLEDVERIEVIRGPGATLWGTNAINGVINIITKHSIDTLGTLAVVGGGTYEKAFTTFRHGEEISKNTFGRAYIKGFKRGNYELSSGGTADDNWKMFQGGGRIDSQLNHRDQFTIQGDFYQGRISEEMTTPLLSAPYSLYSSDTTNTSGANLLGRWQHTESLSSDYTLQAYYDYTSRDDTILDNNHHIFDLDFNHHISVHKHHDIVWGVGYRYIKGDYDVTSGSTLNSESEQLYNFFIQDEISLIDDTLWLTLGSKFEHNDYTDWEVQPSARIFWNLHKQHKLWSSISHAARTPSRFEYDSSTLVGTLAPNSPPNTTPYPASYFLIGNNDFKSEEMTSVEIGYRVIPTRTISIDMSIYYSEYDNLRDFSYGNAVVNNNTISIPLLINNEQSGYTSGFEIASHWQSSPQLNWDLSYNYMDQTINSQNVDNLQSNSPHQNLSLRSNFELNDAIEINLWLKYTDSFESRITSNEMKIDDYTTLDIRLAWQVTKNMNLSLVGQNLLESEHIEYIESGSVKPTEIERGAYLKLLWKY